MIKKLGIHHLLLGIPLAFLLGPLPNMMFWIGKEYANARETALKATNYKASYLDTFKPEYWQYPHFITPSIAGYLLSLTGFDAWYVYQSISF